MISLNLSVFKSAKIVEGCKNVGKVRLNKFLQQETRSPAEALILWTEDALATIGWDREELQYVIDELKSYLEKAAELLCAALNDKTAEKLPVALVGIADRRFVTVTGASGLLDIEEFKWLPEVKLAFLETIQYNLATLFMRRYLLLLHSLPKEGSKK
jgi:hypothetical protein